MTTLYPVNWPCPFCGRVSEQMQMASTSAFGPPDLDTRPPELERSTLGYELARCPGCGFVGLSDKEVGADQIGDSVPQTVDSDAYRSQLNDDALPELASLYLCRALIEADAEDLGLAGWRALSAAWACDDAGEEGAARRCRERALELWGLAKEAGQAFMEEGKSGEELLRADLERRLGRFESATKRCRRSLSGEPEEPIRTLLGYELALISVADTDAHSAGELPIGGLG